MRLKGKKNITFSLSKEKKSGIGYLFEHTKKLRRTRKCSLQSHVSGATVKERWKGCATLRCFVCMRVCVRVKCSVCAGCMSTDGMVCAGPYKTTRRGLRRRTTRGSVSEGDRENFSRCSQELPNRRYSGRERSRSR